MISHRTKIDMYKHRKKLDGSSLPFHSHQQKKAQSLKTWTKTLHVYMQL